MRIMNQIKSDLLDVWEVKRKLFSRNANDLNVKQKSYLEVLEVLTNDPIAEGTNTRFSLLKCFNFFDR